MNNGNVVAGFLKVLGWIALAAGLIVGFIAKDDFSTGTWYEVYHALGFRTSEIDALGSTFMVYCWVTGVVTCLIFLGFGEIVTLLHNIHQTMLKENVAKSTTQEVRTSEQVHN